MRVLSYYDQLPDYMEPDEIAPLFIEFLDTAVTENIEQTVNALVVLKELSVRQWHTYELLDASIRSRTDDWIQQHWDAGIPDIARMSCAIASMLGLSQSITCIYASLQGQLSGEVRSEIERYVKKWGDRPNDPYRDMH